MKNNIDQRLQDVMASVFNVPKDSINNESSDESIETWDSIRHMNFIVALEEEYKISFNDDDMFKITNYSEIKNILSKYLE